LAGIDIVADRIPREYRSAQLSYCR